MNTVLSEAVTSCIKNNKKRIGLLPFILPVRRGKEKRESEEEEEGKRKKN